MQSVQWRVRLRELSQVLKLGRDQSDVSLFKDKPLKYRPGPGLIAGYYVAVSRVAQAWATLRSDEAFPGNVAQPPFSM